MVKISKTRQKSIPLNNSRKLNMPREIAKKKIITFGALAAIIVTGTFAGAQVANSAGETVQPTEITAFREANNSAPAAPALFDKESSITGISLDATTVAAALKSDRLIITKRDANKEIDLEIFEKNETCTGKLGVQSLNVSANGKVIVLKANGDYFSCLTGLTAPEELDSRERVWTLTYVNNNWQPKLIESSQPGYIMSNPAINGEGDEIVYTTDKKLVPEAKEGSNNVYAQNLSTQQVQLLSLLDETGNNGINKKPGEGGSLSAYQPIAAIADLKMSISGRYVGWMTTNASTYSSRMLSDESGNSVHNILVADRGVKTGGTWGKVKMKAVPAQAANGGLDKRSGYLLGFNENEGAAKALYNSSLIINGTTVTETSIYNMTTNKLYSLPTLNQLKAVSHDGTKGISYDYKGPVFGSTSQSSISNLIFYNLDSASGSSTMQLSRSSFRTTETNIIDIKIISDRVLWSTPTTTWELPT